MANVVHANLPDSELHEPKGVATATSGLVYVANGASSGAWQLLPPTSISTGADVKGKAIVSTGTGGASTSTLVWKDLLGDITPKTSGVGAPALGAMRGGNVRGFAYSAGDDGDAVFHIPHDWAVGTDLYLHLHWLHNGTAISGNLIVDIYMTYAKGHNQANFPTETTTQISVSTPNIATVPQYRHRIDEIQITAASPSGSQIATSLIEPDGLLLIHFDTNTIPTITGGTPNEPFFLTLDLHYQSDMLGTANKSPTFYS